MKINRNIKKSSKISSKKSSKISSKKSLNNKINKEIKENNKINEEIKENNKINEEIKENNKINEEIKEKKKTRNIYENIDYKIEPIKLIYKYRNINKKNQYITYIFLGILGKKYEKILNKIENLDLYNTLLEITKEEEIKLIEGFGDMWIIKFFNIYHISLFINKIESTLELKTKLLKKYDLIWLNNFIDKFKNELIFKKINYSYGNYVSFQYKIKMGKKIEKVLIEKEDYEDINYTSEKKSENMVNLFNYQNKKEELYKEGELYKEQNSDNKNWDNILKGGNNEDEEEYLNSEMELDLEEEEDLDNIFPTEITSENDDDIITETKPSLLEMEEEINYDEIEKIYQDDEIDKNINTTNTMISNILDNSKIIEKKINYMIKFDDSKDANIENDNLANVYKKKYIYTQYIFKDDSIKNIKNKICAVIKGNKRLSNDLYLIPSRIYLWSEYIYNEKTEKIMIGQKWLKKNELFNIDIEPLEISNYDNLTPNIKNLRDTMTRFIGKIIREDEEHNILYDYNNFMINDTIYMCDIYNELGQDYKCNTEQLKNITDTFFKIYFPKIKINDIQGIINFLNKSDMKIEENKIKNTFDTIYNDLIIEKEITDLIEITKINKKKDYNKLFEDGNFITQSVIHVNLNIIDEQLQIENSQTMNKINKLKNDYGSVILAKLDLFRIFNDFTPDMKYPFIQYQVPNGQIIFKYYEEYMDKFTKSSENIEMITKWFENSPYGISFKICLNNNNNDELSDKFMAININEIGKVEYKTQWKEEDAANIYDVVNTYEYVKVLISKINKILLNHPRKITIKIPEDYEFRFAFINCIQKFKLPNNKIINHNDLSDFCVFFFPYISIQIEPKKRISKKLNAESKSKYGTYLRYKRVTKFDNIAKIEQRILLYIKNFDFEDDILAEEISKQFNITTARAIDEIHKIKIKFPNISKNKKLILKKSDEIAKFKPPGIGIDIQGKIPEKYKIRISGAREQTQLERIIVFMNILIYLYSETYINKNPEYQEIKDKLKKLTNIAKRRGKVDEIVHYQKEVKIVKKMTQIDKKRLGFTPDEGQNQWTRSCQNSGNDKKRRPLQSVIGNLSQLLSKGYHLNKKTGDYEKKVKIKTKGKKDMEIILKTLKVSDIDKTTGIVNDIYYSCDPEDNGDHMYIGFLTRSNNPFGECMPCCFKKNRLLSKKKETVDFYKQCMQQDKLNGNKQLNLITGDILYILQDTNKIQEGRIAYLPKYLDLIINIHFKKDKEIKNHYLLKTPSYFFKYGINQEDYSFINTLSTVLGISIQNIKDIIQQFLKNDTDELYYLSLNDGDIRAEYRINDFIRFIMESELVDYYYLKDLLKIPGLFTKNGILPIIFNKTILIKNNISNDKIKEDFYLLIDNSMVIDFNYFLNMFEDRDILIIIKDGKYYYPVIEISKNDQNSKNIEIKKLFNKSCKEDLQIVDLMKDFYNNTILDVQIDYIKSHISGRETNIILEKISIKNPEFTVQYQAVDSRFKCKYIITKDNLIIPVLPSGIINNLPIICLNSIEYSKKQDCFSNIKLKNLNDTQKYLEKLYILSNKKLNIKPIGLFYDFISEDNFANIIGIMTSNNDIVPIINQLIPIKELDKNKVIYKNRPLYYKLDIKLENYNKNYFEIIDERIKNVNRIKYLDEAYQLFKFELSNILSTEKYKSTKNELKKLIENKKNLDIQELLLTLCVSKLDDKIINKDLIGNELVKIIEDIPDVDYYKINNQRLICNNLNENECLTNPHCDYIVDTKVSNLKSKPKCTFILTEKYLLEFIKKISIELCEQEIKVYELLKEKKYYVQDIVNYNNFVEKPGQKIIKSSNANLHKILADLFGKEHKPLIGRRHLFKKYDNDIQILQSENPLKDIKDAYSQLIIPNNYSIIRAYINGYYWFKHKLYNIYIRNLGYYSDLQNDIVNLFRSLIIDWLNIPDNIKLLIELPKSSKEILKNPIVYIDLDSISSSSGKIIINKYIVKLMQKNLEDNFGFFELFIFNNIHKIPIVVLFNGIPKYFINNDIKLINSDNNKKYLNTSNICISIDFNLNNKNANIIEAIYYK